MIRKKNFNFKPKKKAISPLIATILLIVVAVAIIAIVVLWGKGFTREGLDTSDKISVYSESDVSFYIFHNFSMNGRTVIEYKPLANSPFKDLNIIGYGIIGLTNHIVPFDQPIIMQPNSSANIDHGVILPEIDLVLYLDNQTIITKKKLRQEIKQPSSCKEGYIPVPGNHLYGTMNKNGGFCVMKWEAKTDANTTVQTACRNHSTRFSWSHAKTGTGYDCNVSSYNIVSTAENYPIVNIAQSDVSSFDSKEACASAGGHLITNNEWMTIARNIELVSDNWSEGVIGQGYLPRGNTDNVLVGGTYVYDGSTPGAGVNKRTLKLTNGQEIWDLSGNVLNWVDKTQTTNYFSGCTDNLDSCYFYSTSEYEIEAEYSQLFSNLNYLENIYYKDLFLLNSEFNRDNGVGYFYNYFYDSEIAFLRGGGWANGPSAGVLSLDLAHASSSTASFFGLRCVQ
jgi:hypothetical protein